MKNEFTESEIENMLKSIPAPQPYATWMQILSAVFAVLPFSPGVQLLNKWSPEQKEGEYAAKHKSRLQEIGIGSLIHIARQHGWRGDGKGGKLKFAASSLPPGVITAVLELPRPSWIPNPGAALMPVQHQPHGVINFSPLPANVRNDTRKYTAPRPAIPPEYCTTCWSQRARALKVGSCVCTGDVRHGTFIPPQPPD